MSGWQPCTCEGTFKEKRKNWYVYRRNYNLSYFESPKGGRHYSEWSSVGCRKCLANFRTKANYVSELPNE